MSDLSFFNFFYLQSNRFGQYNEPAVASGFLVKQFSTEENADEFGHLTLPQVYVALTYYHANRDEIETVIATEEKVARQLEQQYDRSVGE